MPDLYELGRISLADMTHVSAQLRRLGDGARSMEEAGSRIVRFLFDSFGDAASGEKSCVLARMYKTHVLAQLPAPLQDFARDIAPQASPATRCLALLSTAGLEAAWNSRHQSSGHRAIPLTSVEAVARLPMVAQLIAQLGFDVARVVATDLALIVDHDQTTFNVFHVPRARGSPFIPAQEGFVVPYGVESVLGFGGALPGGEIFAVILFARTPITRNTAELFKPLALAAKLALLPFARGPVFDA
ncbi:MAG: hypothetical protein LC689_20020 [Myxococcales bacterium]|nr:hypothetical protein [Myxococcales bacterium]